MLERIETEDEVKRRILVMAAAAAMTSMRLFTSSSVSIRSSMPLPTDLVFDPTLAHRGFRLRYTPSRPSQSLICEMGADGASYL